MVAFSGRFQVNKVGRIWGADGTANAKAQKREATWYVQNDDQTDIAVCMREYMMKRVAGEASRSLYVKILIYHGKKLILNPLELCLPNFTRDK